LRFQIDPAIFETFPRLHIGVVRVKDLDNHGDRTDLMEKMEQIQKDIRENFRIETLTECPKIQNWRKAFALFGAKPKKHRSSVENLYRMILEGRDLRPINKVVDIYNCVSLEHMVPVGGDDMALVDGDIVLRFAAGDEPFVPLGPGEPQTARKGEVIYADNRDVLCRRWNWRECEKTKMTEETQDVLLVSEGLPPVTEEEISRIAADLKGMICQYCGGEAEVAVLGMNRGEWQF
jgi:lysyl-tRNA synthetase class 2